LGNKYPEIRARVEEFRRGQTAGVTEDHLL